jgi:hypothetical protein
MSGNLTGPSCLSPNSTYYLNLATQERKRYRTTHAVEERIAALTQALNWADRGANLEAENSGPCSQLYDSLTFTVQTSSLCQPVIFYLKLAIQRREEFAEDKTIEERVVALSGALRWAQKGASLEEREGARPCAQICAEITAFCPPDLYLGLAIQKREDFKKAQEPETKTTALIEALKWAQKGKDLEGVEGDRPCAQIYAEISTLCSLTLCLNMAIQKREEFKRGHGRKIKITALSEALKWAQRAINLEEEDERVGSQVYVDTATLCPPDFYLSLALQKKEEFIKSYTKEEKIVAISETLRWAKKGKDSVEGKFEACAQLYAESIDLCPPELCQSLAIQKRNEFKDAPTREEKLVILSEAIEWAQRGANLECPKPGSCTLLCNDLSQLQKRIKGSDRKKGKILNDTGYMSNVVYPQPPNPLRGGVIFPPINKKMPLRRIEEIT